MTRRWCQLLLATICAGVMQALAQVQIPAPLPGPDVALEQRLKLLETELRCLVCQNQTLADSPAGLADDLRREIRSLAAQGKSNEDIKVFLQARYGDFVLYKPPLKESTWLLWIGPFALLGLSGVVFAVVLRRRALPTAATVPVVASEADRARVRDLLDKP